MICGIMLLRVNSSNIKKNFCIKNKIFIFIAKTGYTRVGVGRFQKDFSYNNDVKYTYAIIELGFQDQFSYSIITYTTSER